MLTGACNPIVCLIPVFSTLEGHTAAIFALQVAHDGRLYSGSHDYSVRIWSKAGKQLNVLNGAVTPPPPPARFPQGPKNISLSIPPTHFRTHC